MQWIPGDAGYFANDTYFNMRNPPGAGIYTGKNVFYVGGCFLNGSGFYNSAEFFGNGEGTKTIPLMKQAVSHFNEGNSGVTIFPDRRYLAQPYLYAH